MSTTRALAIVFPGQGCQRPTMGLDFLDRYPESRAVFEEASDAIGFDIAAICAGEAAGMEATEIQQPAILTVELAMLAALRDSHGWQPTLFAGHSLGEYAALVAAGVLSLADAVRLVHLRGRLMQEAVPAGAGAMRAIIHHDLDVAWLAGVTAPHRVDVASHNGLDQAVLSGLAADVEEAVEALKAAASFRVRTIVLRVSAPFHSRHMKPVQEPLLAALEAVPAVQAALSVRVLSNTTGSLHTGSRADLERRLVEQVTSTVRWVDDMRELLDRGCEVVEVGPGRPLRGFFASLDVEIRSVLSVDTIAEARA